jgi:hypothetical protein
VYIWCHNASEHLLSMSMYIYCHSVNIQLLSQCQCTSTVTMPVNIYCHSVNVHLLSVSIYNYCHNVSVHLLSQCQCICGVTIPVISPSINYNFVLQVSEYTQQTQQYVFIIKKEQIKVDGFSMALEYVLWQNGGEDYVHHCDIHTCS